MESKEVQHLIDTILKQQNEITKLRDKIAYLHVIIDTLGRELENARRNGLV